MKTRLLSLLLLPIISSLFLTSCETTSTGYGYYIGELSDGTIVEFFELCDQAARDQDFNTYSSFFGPNFVAIDRTEGMVSHVYRLDYFDMVEDIFASASEVDLRTVVMDIQYTDTGASLKVQEEERVVQFGKTRHYTSILDIELGYEDGWLFQNKTVRTSQQVIEE